MLRLDCRERTALNHFPRVRNLSTFDVSLPIPTSLTPQIVVSCFEAAARQMLCHPPEATTAGQDAAPQDNAIPIMSIFEAMWIGKANKSPVQTRKIFWTCLPKVDIIDGQ